MKKNVSGQTIGAQLVSATDGSAFTGSVTVSVTGDGGTQATGSVGSGACTHEGNGYHTYAPAQAETDYDLIAFTFTGTGAVPVTVQVFTSFPQTGDSFARLGAPAGASLAADIAVIESQTDDIGVAGAGLTALATQASVDTIDNLLDTEVGAIKTVVDAIQAKTDNLPTDPADESLIIAATDAIAARLPAALIGGRMDATVGAMQSDVLTSTAVAASAVTEIQGSIGTEVTAIKAKTDSLTFTQAGLVDANVQSINDTAVSGDGSSGDPWGPA